MIDTRSRGRRVELRNLAIDAAHLRGHAEGHLSAEGDAIGSLVIRTAGREAARHIANRLEINPKLLGRAEAEQASSEGMEFGFGLQAIPTIAPQIRSSLTAAGEYGDQLESYMVEAMNLGWPGWEWELQDRARVNVTGDQNLEVASMLLRNNGQELSLDGTYSSGGSNPFSVICNGFDGSKLPQLFEVETLKWRFPRMILEELRGLVPEKAKPPVSGARREELDEFLERPGR